jgi:fatty-acid desaturase
MKNYKFILFIFIPFNLLFLIGLWMTSFSYLNLFYFILGYIFIGALGVEIGLHKWASHRSVELNFIAKPIIILASLLACQGHPIWWSAVHRGYHHRNTDTDLDLHTPKKSKWNSFLGWIIKHEPSSINYKYAVDLLKNPLMTITSKYYEAIVWTIWIVLGIISLDFLIWFLIIPTVLSFYGVGLINTFCHGNGGYRNFNTADNSKNVALLGFLLWGNGWHNNHHYKASSFDFGSSISGKKWEIDPCIFLLPFIKKYD